MNLLTTKCAHCGRPAAVYCVWPVEKFTEIKASELRAGDRVMLTGHEDAVTMVTPSHDGHLIYLTLQNVKGERWRYASDWVIAFRPAPCEEPCCERCCREVSEGVHYGKCCWDKWRVVAA